MNRQEPEARFRPKKNNRNQQRMSSVVSQFPVSSAASQVSVNSATIIEQRTHEDHDSEDGDDEDNQDILEVWFAGQHGDIGGGEHTER